MFASRRFIHLPRRLSVNLRPTLVNLRPTLRVASQALREFSAASSSGGDKKNLKLADISIDTSGLVQRPVLDESSTVLDESNTNDVDCTAMESELIKLITLRGPITIAEYMRQVLTHPKFGYYSTQEKEDTKIFGAGGSFTTSPEISQLFGESIAVFILNQWEVRVLRVLGTGKQCARSFTFLLYTFILTCPPPIITCTALWQARQSGRC